MTAWETFRQKMVIIGIPLLIFIIYTIMSGMMDMRLAVPEWLFGCALITILIATGYYLGQKPVSGWSYKVIIGIGAVLRILFLIRPPELSDDIFRYVFDGHMLLYGHNPYQVSPLEALAANPLLSRLVASVNHADLPTIYPPAAQLVFAVGALLGGLAGMKIVMVGLDILSCVMMAGMLQHLGRPKSCLILYAWHPLPILEIAGSGHIDGAVIFFLLLSCFWALRTKEDGNRYTKTGKDMSGWAAGICFAMAVLTKWLPLMLLPGLVLMIRPAQREQAGVGFLATLAVMTAVFWPEIQNGFHTLFLYLANWEFSGWMFRTIRSLTGSGRVTRLILVSVFGMWSCWVYFLCIRINTGLWQRITTAHVLKIFEGFYWIVMGFLILTPTLHPWYALYLAMLLPFSGGAAGIVFSWSVFLGYRVLILYGLTGQWIENDFFPFLLVAGPTAAGLLAEINRIMNQKWRKSSLLNHLSG